MYNDESIYNVIDYPVTLLFWRYKPIMCFMRFRMDQYVSGIRDGLILRDFT